MGSDILRGGSKSLAPSTSSLRRPVGRRGYKQHREIRSGITPLAPSRAAFELSKSVGWPRLDASTTHATVRLHLPQESRLRVRVGLQGSGSRPAGGPALRWVRSRASIRTESYVGAYGRLHDTPLLNGARPRAPPPLLIRQGLGNPSKSSSRDTAVGRVRISWLSHASSISENSLIFFALKSPGSRGKVLRMPRARFPSALPDFHR